MFSSACSLVTRPRNPIPSESSISQSKPTEATDSSVNYTTSPDDLQIEDAGRLFEKGGLREISQIIHENVSVTILDQGVEQVLNMKLSI